MFGYNSAATGANVGVRGRVESENVDAAGVFGDATDRSGQAHGVLGETNSRVGGAGVRGRGTSSGWGYADGVYGTTEAWGVTFGVRNPAAGVRGRATNGSGTTSGVLGENPSGQAGNSGIEGHAESTSGRVYGARGRTSSEHSETAGVYGVARNNSTQGYGVHGEVLYSTGDDAAGVNATAPHPAAALNAEGWVDVADVGAQAYLSSDQSIPDGSYTKVQFDTTEVNHQTQFDTTNHEFVVPRAGHYFVDASVEFAEQFSGGAIYVLSLQVDGGAESRERFQIPSGSTNDAYTTLSASKLLPNLSAGQTISASVYQSDGGSRTLQAGIGTFPAQSLNYLSVVKVG